MYGYVYLTVNKVNGKKYIGQHHANKLDPYYLGSGILIGQAIDKYGADNFSVSIIEECNSLEELNDREAYWIEYYNAVEDNTYYNLVPGGNQWNPMKGKHHTPEAIEKCRQANLGRVYSKERCEQMSKAFSGEGNPRYGCKISEEQKAKQLKSLMKYREEHPDLDKKHSEFMKEYYSTHEHPMNGRLHSEETREKIRQKAIGRKISDETKAKMSKAQKGIPKKVMRKPVMCIETGEIYECAEEACKGIGIKITSQQCISRCARNTGKGIKDIAFGFHWKYVDKN